MRALTEIKGDAALDMIADLIDPITEITSDEDVKNAYRDGNKAQAIKVSIKNHKQAVKSILAVLEEKDADEYQPSIADMIYGIQKILLDETLKSLFTLPNQNQEEDTFGSVSESTKGKE